jgi:hypothetical protein
MRKQASVVSRELGSRVYPARTGHHAVVRDLQDVLMRCVVKLGVTNGIQLDSLGVPYFMRSNDVKSATASFFCSRLGAPRKREDHVPLKPLASDAPGRSHRPQQQPRRRSPDARRWFAR